MLGKSVVEALLRNVEDVTGQNTIFRKPYRYMLITIFPNVYILDIVNTGTSGITMFLSKNESVCDGVPIII